MRKEFESELAKEVSGRSKGPSRLWIAAALCAAVLIVGVAATTVVAASNGNMMGDCDQDRLQDGSCEDGEPIQDQIRDQLKDGSCEDDGDDSPTD